MQSVYWADYLGEKDGKVYLLRKRAPMLGSKWKEEVLFTEVAGLDTEFLKVLRKQEKTTKSTANIEILKKTLKGLNLDDPTADMEKQTANNDLRFVGINGYTCYPPGVEKEDMKLAQKYDIRCLEGTSDNIENEGHGKLIEAAIKYAETYNRALIQKLKRIE